MSNQVVALSEYRRLRWDGAVEAFLAAKQLSPATHRTYRLALDTVGHQIGSDTPLDEIHPEQLLGVFLARWGDSTPNTWNTRLIAVRSFLSFCGVRGWIDRDPLELVDRRRPPRDRTSKAISVTALETLWARRDVHLREKALWRLLYETAARATEALNLNIEDTDFHLRQATIIGKGGHRELIFWASGAARVLSRYLHGRSRGPVFLTHRKPRLAPAMRDLCPTTGRARLSYETAAKLFKQATDGKWTLHQLRHSSLTHMAENGINTEVLMAKSRHRDRRSLDIYARPGPAAVAQATATFDKPTHAYTR